jgi:hypothetical protein
VTSETRAWLDGLRDFAATQRERKPLVDVTRPTPLQAAERMIIAADLATRLPAIDGLRAERAAWVRRSSTDADLDPAIAITTSAVGIAAVAELLASPTHGLDRLAARAVAVTELEYRLWCIRHPDEGHRLHVNLWSWVKTRVPEQRWAEFARHPLGAGETYWLHRAGVAGAGLADCRHCHLWRWNGRHASLLEPFVQERSVAHLDRGSGGERDRD